MTATAAPAPEAPKVDTAPKTEPAKDAKPAEAKKDAAPAKDAPKVEAKPPEPAKPEPDKRAQAWEKITAAEARMREERAALKREREQFAKERAEIDELRKLREADPAGLIEKLGGRAVYEEATRRYLNNGQASPEEIFRKQEERIAQLEAQRREDARRSEEEKHAGAAREYLGALGKELSSGKYELIEAFGAQNEVANLVAQWAQEHGEVLTPEQAAGRIEAELEAMLPKLRGAKKFAALLGSQQDPPTKEVQPSSAPAKGQKTPLSSELSAGSPVESRKPKSRRELIKEAAARLNGSR